MSAKPPLASGINVTVTLIAGLQVSGTVRWTWGAAFGLRLGQHIDVDVIAHGMRKQIVAQRAVGQWEIPSRHQNKTSGVGLRGSSDACKCRATKH